MSDPTNGHHIENRGGTGARSVPGVPASSGAGTPGDVGPAPEPRTGPPSAAQHGCDVLLTGTVFLDIIFTGLPRMPSVGTEVWGQGLGSSPGGVANLAVALRRLQQHTVLAAAFGEDVYGDYLWGVLEHQEQVDLSYSRRFWGWHSPVTVSMAVDRDRSMVTHGHYAPVEPDELLRHPPHARACFVHLDLSDQQWVRKAKDNDTLLFADVGWDPSGTWDSALLRCLDGYDVFLPNAVEAMSYTRADSPEQAAHRLAERVPLVVVTRGGQGAYAVDSATGETADVAGLNIAALDPTGAGDVFAAGFVTGTLAGWPLQDRVRFANLCAALSVQHLGGSLSAPGWQEIATWWEHYAHRDDEELRGYGFLARVLPLHMPTAVRRATATIELRDRT